MKVRLSEDTKAFIEQRAALAYMNAADIYRLCFEVGVSIVKKEGIAGLVRHVEALQTEVPQPKMPVSGKHKH